MSHTTQTPLSALGIRTAPDGRTTGGPPDPTLTFLASLDDPNKWVIRRRVPIFIPHDVTFPARQLPDGTTIPPRRNVVTEAELPAIAADMQLQERANGVVAPLTLGHIDPFEKDETKQAKVGGIYRNAVVGRWGPEQKIGILADEYLLAELEPERHNYPHRSVDYIARTKQIKAVAILARPPMLNMGMVGLSGFDIVDQYELPIGGQEMTNPATPTIPVTGPFVTIPISALPVGFNFAAMGAGNAGLPNAGGPSAVTPGAPGTAPAPHPFEAIGEGMRQYCIQKYGLPPEWPAGKTLEEEPKLKESEGVTPMQQPIQFQLPDGRLVQLPAGSRMVPAAPAIPTIPAAVPVASANPVLDQYAAQMAHLQSVVVSMQQQSTQSECASVLYQLQAEGYQFDPAGAPPTNFQYELGELMKRAPQDRAAHAQRLRTYYAASKIPSSGFSAGGGAFSQLLPLGGNHNGSLPLPNGQAGAYDAADPFSAPPWHDAAMQYMMSHDEQGRTMVTDEDGKTQRPARGCSYPTAVAAVKKANAAWASL